MRRAIAVAMVLVLAGSGCFGGKKRRDPSVLQVTRSTGTVEVLDGEKWSPAGEGATVKAGGAVRVAAGAEVVLARGDKSSIELRGGDERGEISIGDTVADVTVRNGDVLVHSDPTAPLTVLSGGTVARAAAPAVFRFDRRLRVRIGSYSGAVDVSVEQTVALPALPSLDEWLVNPRVAPVRRPYSLEPSDPWDRRLLADAIEIEQSATPLQTGYEARFGAKTGSVAELDAIGEDAGRDLGFVSRFLARSPSSDVLMGLVYALLLEGTGKGSAPALFAELMQRSSQGAAWGLIAHEHGLRPADVLRAVTCAISLRTGETDPGEGCFTTAEPSPTQTGGGRPRPTGRPTRAGPSPTPTRTRSPGPTPTPTPTEPTPTPTATPTCSVVDMLLNGGTCP